MPHRPWHSHLMPPRHGCTAGSSSHDEVRWWGPMARWRGAAVPGAMWHTRRPYQGSYAHIRHGCRSKPGAAHIVAAPAALPRAAHRHHLPPSPTHANTNTHPHPHPPTHTAARTCCGIRLLRIHPEDQPHPPHKPLGARQALPVLICGRPHPAGRREGEGRRPALRLLRRAASAGW